MKKNLLKCLLGLSAMLWCLSAAGVEIPTFDKWEVKTPPAGYVGQAVTVAPDTTYPQGRIVAKAVPGEKYIISAVCTVPVEARCDYSLELRLQGVDFNENAVPAFRETVVTAQGASVIVNDGGLPHPAGGLESRRVFRLSKEKLAQSRDGTLELSFYVMGLTRGAFALTGVQLTPCEDDEEGHDPANLSDGGGLIFNEDCTEFFATRPDADMNIEGLKRYMDRYLVARHQIRIVMLNPGAYNNNYGANVGPVMWEGVTFNADGTATDRFGHEVAPATTKMYLHMKGFVDQGINVYKVWIDHLRERGVSPWISLRMNDAHDALTPDEERVDFRKDPDFRIAAYNPGDWHDQAADYEKPEVRDFYTRIMHDYMDTFDADGFEIDWMRFGRNFKHGREIVCAPLLTDMMRDFRKYADELAARRGHPIRLAARVPSRLDHARRLGYDVETWAKEKLIDILIPTNFLWTTDADTPVAEWRRLVGPDILLAPGMERTTDCYVNTGFQGDAAIRRGFAAGWFHRGADMIYLFNHMSMPPDLNSGVMRTVGAAATAEKGDRRHILTFPDFPAQGFSRFSELPVNVSPKTNRAFRLVTGKAPAAGRAAWVVVGFGSPDKGVRPACRLDSRPLEGAARMPPVELGSFIKWAYAWRIPDGALFDDENVVEITNTTDGPLDIRWVEIYIEKE